MTFYNFIPELNSLTLLAPWLATNEQGYSKIISEHGLEKMPNLQNIKLVGGFEVLFLKVNTIFNCWSVCIIISNIFKNFEY